VSSAGSDLALVAADGEPLAARDFAPDGSARGAVLIAPAMGVAQDFYAPLAGWLAERGFRALSFDYRGSGRSRTRPLRGLDADVLTWARLDAGAALAALRARAGDVPLLWLGHSLGGQIVPFVPGHEAIARIVAVAAGSGYWRQNAPALRRKVWLFWWGAAPLLTPLFGYFPGRRLGMVGDLPRGVIEQWRRWCMHPEYAAGAEPGAREAYAAVRAPITAIGFADDEMLSRASIEALLAAYRGAATALRFVAPAEVGLARIGHFGFFRAERRALWEALLAPALAADDEAPRG
jgi:predicted alpha/beta hydrolase